MANNYRQFSEILDLSSDPTKAAEERAWWERVEKVREAEDTEAELRALGIDPCSIDEWSTEFFPDFHYSIEKDNVWIYAEEYGNVEDVAAVTQAFLKRFHPEWVWSLSWADYCDKPRIDEFHGGVLVVSAKGVCIETTSEVRRRLVEEAAKELK